MELRVTLVKPDRAPRLSLLNLALLMSARAILLIISNTTNQSQAIKIKLSLSHDYI